MVRPLHAIGYRQRENPNSDGREQSSFGRDRDDVGPQSQSARYPEIKQWEKGEEDCDSANKDLPRFKEGRIEQSRKQATAGERESGTKMSLLLRFGGCFPGIDHSVAEKTLAVFGFRHHFINDDDRDGDEKKQEPAGEAAVLDQSINGKKRNETGPEVFG